ncbi:MAG: flagellar motor protein MotB [Lachnospiraceae bacterium]|nr:flagellar motor protein MotB [Lachnospiraceae bacterium]
MKKKQEEPPKGSPAWMATFSDLMNLLLCFFVLLFSMSSVDESKVEAMLKSLQDTFSIFSGGGSSFEDGILISSGATQLSNLDEYFNTTGKTDDGESVDNVDDNERGAENIGDGDNNSELGQNSDNLEKTGDNSAHTPTAEEPNQGSSGADSDKNAGTELTADQLAALADEKEKELNKAESTVIYEEIIGLLDKTKVLDDLDITIDSETYQFIQIEISGAVLFDAGKDTVKDNALPILSRLGNILKQYREYKIEVIGHTDNTPTNIDYFANNDILSACRAISVATYFAEDKGIGWGNLYYAGRGDHEPVADNSTEEGRAQNRRVEIRLYNQRSSK